MFKVIIFLCVLTYWFLKRRRFIDTPQVNQNSKYHNFNPKPIVYRGLYSSNLIQGFCYLLNKKKERQLAKVIYNEIRLKLKCGTKLQVLHSKNVVVNNNNPVILICHSIFGRASESAHLAQRMIENYNWKVYSYTRRGNGGIKLVTPRFNTVGHQEDLKLILKYIKNRHPESPICCIASSAGTSLLSRYLGEAQNKSLVNVAIMLSPGYDLEKALDHLKSWYSKRLVHRAKKVFLIPNKDILQEYNKEAYNSMMKCKNLKEWHEYQYIFEGSKDKQEYIYKNNPGPFLKNITIPVLYISAHDDIVFPGNLIQKDLPNSCEKTVIVATKHGGHLGFYESWNKIPASYRMAEEFLINWWNNHNGL